MYGSIAAGIALSVTTLPRGFTHQTMLVLGNGINATFQRWGEATLALAGKQCEATIFQCAERCAGRVRCEINKYLTAPNTA